MVVSAVVVGFMAGLFGIGGGLIMVPVLFYVFSFVGIDRTFVMHLAIGTSFSNIVPNTTPITTKTPKVLTILKSTALNFICVIVDIIEFGIIIEKDVPTAKCITIVLSIPTKLNT